MKSRMTYRTVTGKDIIIGNLKPGDIDIQTIARGLAKQNRYNGQGNSDLTVLTHSMWVAHKVLKQSQCTHTTLLALLHDASEAYISDIHGGTKRMFTEYMRFEQKLSLDILEQLGIKGPNILQQNIIKHHDKAIVSEEKHFLFGAGNHTVHNVTEQRFIAYFNELKTAINPISDD